MPATLGILGCGRLGRTLARLWLDAGVFLVGDVVTRSHESASSATAFVGAGRASAASAYLVKRPDPLALPDAWLIAAPDGAIAELCAALAGVGAIAERTVVFHCSGALTSAALDAARAAGAYTASVHPVRSFAEPAAAVSAFPGTWCGVEGDEDALARLRPAFEAIGARLFEIDPEQKTVYHAGAVMACNYLVTLIETGLRCYARAGVPREVALHVLEPLVRGTVDNVFRQDTTEALTGPIARGETEVVAAQVAALEAIDPGLAAAYRALGRETLPLASAQGSAPPAALIELARLLERGV